MVDPVVKHVFDGFSRIGKRRYHAGFLAADMHFVAAADIDIFCFFLSHAIAAHQGFDNARLAAEHEARVAGADHFQHFINDLRIGVWVDLYLDLWVV